MFAYLLIIPVIVTTEYNTIIEGGLFKFTLLDEFFFFFFNLVK